MRALAKRACFRAKAGPSPSRFARFPLPQAGEELVQGSSSISGLNSFRREISAPDTMNSPLPR